jgi:hypothetical protein
MLRPYAPLTFAAPVMQPFRHGVSEIRDLARAFGLEPAGGSGVGHDHCSDNGIHRFGSRVVGYDGRERGGCARRNERTEPTIAFIYNGKLIDTGTEKFGALVGDRARIGANAVIAPGAVLLSGTIVSRLALVDQAIILETAP